VREAAECRSRRSKRSDLSNYSRAEGDYIQQIRLSQHCSDTSMFHFDKRKHLKDFHCMNVSRVNIFKGKLLARGPVGGYVQLLGLA